jgi:hypothetical protein
MLFVPVCMEMEMLMEVRRCEAIWLRPFFYVRSNRPAACGRISGKGVTRD